MITTGKSGIKRSKGRSKDGKRRGKDSKGRSHSRARSIERKRETYKRVGKSIESNSGKFPVMDRTWYSHRLVGFVTNSIRMQTIMFPQK